MESDCRLTWLGQLVERTLNVSEETTMFDDLLALEGGKYRRQLLKFLNGSLTVSTIPHSEIAPDGQHYVDNIEDQLSLQTICFWMTTIDIESEEQVFQAATGTETLSTHDTKKEEVPNIESSIDGEDKIMNESGNDGVVSVAREDLINESKLESPNELEIADDDRSPPPPGSPDSCDEAAPSERSQSTVDEEIQMITMKRRKRKRVLHIKDSREMRSRGSETESLLSKRAEEFQPDADAESLFLYLVRTTKDSIPIPSSMDEAEQIIPLHLMSHVVSLNLINESVFSHLLRQVYLPLLKIELYNEYFQHKIIDEKFDVHKVLGLNHNDILSKQTILGDILTYLERNDSNENQITTYFCLPNEIRGLADSGKVNLDAIEGACRSWTDIIENTVAVMRAKLNSCFTPMDEVNFWLENYKVLVDMVSNFYNEDIVICIKLLTNENNRCLANFDYQRGELEQLLLQFEEISRYMDVLKPYFKVLHSEDASLKKIRQLIPCIMVKLRLIWGASKFLSTPTFMGPLLQRIANQLYNRVVTCIDLESLSSTDPSVQSKGLQQVNEAKQLMDEWKKCYLEMRTATDFVGPVPPWEFDRKRLFEATDYLGGLCQNVIDIFQILGQFETSHRLGLEAAFYEIEQIKILYRKIEELRFGIFDLSYDPLVISNGPAWKCTMDQFRRDVSSLDAEFINLFKEGFGHLKSARSALDLVNNFYTLPCRPSLRNIVKQVMKEISQKLITEIDDLGFVFKKNQTGPFYYKNLSPVSSSICWARRLLQQVHLTVSIFTQTAEVDTLKDDVNNKFNAFQSETNQFQELKFHEWSTLAQSSISNLMQLNVLKKVTDEQNCARRYHYEANFSQDLFVIFNEARHLEELGFKIPKQVYLISLNASLLFNQLFTVNEILSKYENKCQELEDGDNIDMVTEKLERGCKWISWTSLNLKEYLDDCLRQINDM